MSIDFHARMQTTVLIKMLSRVIEKDLVVYNAPTSKAALPFGLIGAAQEGNFLLLECL